MRLKTATPETIDEAAACLRGGLVAIPTETVYGLAADATNGAAVARIFEAKGRPAFNPLICHFARAEDIESAVVTDTRAQTVAAAFWPGPLTLILPRRTDCRISELCSAGLETLAVRVPAHPIARALIAAAGVPLAAPSANKSGRISPTTPLLVSESLGNAVDMILAAGPCAVGLESTVLDLSGDTPTLLRPGAVTAADIESVLGYRVEDGTTTATDKPKSPGLLLKHYAPSIPVRMNAIDLEEGEALLAFGSVKFMGIRTGGAARDLPPERVRNLSPRGDLHEAAANLFRMLHELDRPQNKGIAVMAIPETGLGLAINDRLGRTAKRTD